MDFLEHLYSIKKVKKDNGQAHKQQWSAGELSSGGVPYYVLFITIINQMYTAGKEHTYFDLTNM